MSKDSIEKLKIGALSFSLGSDCTYIAIFRPLEMAKAGAPSLTTSRLMMAVAPIMVIYGAAYIWFPKFVEQHLGGYPGQRSSQHLTPLGWIFMLANLILGIGLAIWASSQLSAMGYDFRL